MSDTEGYVEEAGTIEPHVYEKLQRSTRAKAAFDALGDELKRRQIKLRDLIAKAIFARTRVDSVRINCLIPEMRLYN